MPKDRLWVLVSGVQELGQGLRQGRESQQLARPSSSPPAGSLCVVQQLHFGRLGREEEIVRQWLLSQSSEEGVEQMRELPKLRQR